MKLTSKGQKIIIVKADISKTKECEKIFQTFLEHFKSLNVLINNAGIFGPMGDLTKIDWEAFVENINVNLLGTIYMCRLAIPLLKSKKTSNIIISLRRSRYPFSCFSLLCNRKGWFNKVFRRISRRVKKKVKLMLTWLPLDH